MSQHSHSTSQTRPALVRQIRSLPFPFNVRLCKVRIGRSHECFGIRNACFDGFEFR
jgi:hypothetical protein